MKTVQNNVVIVVIIKLLTAPVLVFPAQAFADSPIYTSFFGNEAVSGYDTVAYFDEDKPVKGNEQFSTQYKGATWLFKSQKSMRPNTVVIVRGPLQTIKQPKVTLSNGASLMESYISTTMPTFNSGGRMTGKHLSPKPTTIGQGLLSNEINSLWKEKVST